MYLDSQENGLARVEETLVTVKEPNRKYRPEATKSVN